MAKTLVHIDTNAVTSRIMGEWKKALPLLTEEILNDCNQYVKYREGALLTSSQTATNFKEGIMVVDNGGFIAQAERQCVNARIQGSAATMSAFSLPSLI